MKVLKYRNEKVKVDGILFDSKKEARRYGELKMLKKAGKIKDFSIQYPFVFVLNKEKIFKYKADFRVEHLDGSVEVEDVKGFDRKTKKFRTTPLFKLKKKLIEAQFGIKIKLV